tara:strand:+ start:830 stop:1312 length:483 start_codon:yes stop_codon:yes gene_type:complete
MSIDTHWKASRHLTKDVFLEINAQLSRAQTKLKILLDSENLPAMASSPEYAKEVVECLKEVASTNNTIQVLAGTIGREAFTELTSMFQPPADRATQHLRPEDYAAKLAKSKEESATEKLHEFLKTQKETNASSEPPADLYKEKPSESDGTNRASRRKKKS